MAVIALSILTTYIYIYIYLAMHDPATRPQDPIPLLTMPAMIVADASRGIGRCSAEF